MPEPSLGTQDERDLLLAQEQEETRIRRREREDEMDGDPWWRQ